jgi:hypothetical protein
MSLQSGAICYFAVCYYNLEPELLEWLHTFQTEERIV